jgi:hypothetical protein
LNRKTFYSFLPKEHLDQSHPNPKCEHCDEQFGSSNTLNEHKVSQCQKVSSDNERLNVLISNFLQVKSAVQEIDDFLETSRANLDILNQDLASLKKDIKDMEYTSKDGTMVWKITNVREKMGK